MTNTKLTWTKPAFDLPNDFREVLISRKEFPETFIGFYSSELGKWITSIDGENVIIDDVEFWMDKPNKPQKCQSYLFRTANEARYLTELKSTMCAGDEEYSNFCKVRASIMEACISGDYWVTLHHSYFGPKVLEGLKRAGFALDYDSADNVTISWKNE